MNKLFLSCEEASHVCDKAQYNESTLWERLKLILHIMFCNLCRKHTINNKKLTDTMNKSNIVCLDSKSKSEMKKFLEEELKNSNSKH